MFFFFSSSRRHTRCALVTGVQTCALPIYGRRPDFRLRFNVSASAADLERGFRQSIFGNLAKQHSGLVMDAKFRTRWKHGELADMLKLLVDTKDYGQDG